MYIYIYIFIFIDPGISTNPPKGYIPKSPTLPPRSIPGRGQRGDDVSGACDARNAWATSARGWGQAARPGSDQGPEKIYVTSSIIGI